VVVESGRTPRKEWESPSPRIRETPERRTTNPRHLTAGNQRATGDYRSYGRRRGEKTSHTWPPKLTTVRIIRVIATLWRGRKV
jgi:hypothetical protein